MSYWLHRRGSPIRWQLGFETLRAAIGPLLGDLDATTEHVGSTPVPGPAAQPIIDVAVLVAGLDEVGAAIAVLRAAGWTRLGDPYRAEGAFGPGAAPRTTASTWSLMASKAHRDHVRHRDHLRANPRTADEVLTGEPADLTDELASVPTGHLRLCGAGTSALDACRESRTLTAIVHGKRRHHRPATPVVEVMFHVEH